MRGLLELDVSRETLDALKYFEDLVVLWNPAINLISNSSVSDLWSRHIVDSAQLFLFTLPDEGLWLDVGSGGGFPGIVVSIIAKELAPSLRVVLVESDNRKCVFLRTVIRELGLSVKVINDRIENVKLDDVVYLSARALRNLNSLLFIVENNVSRETVCVFPKGRSYKKELVESQKNWKFDFNLIDSNTSEDSKVIVLKGLERVS
ncbi:MAG: 16S rRNA (guanine(527)-N(7))-methyltransferase RsmG [Paracoccaceae bacterium]|nr:16S rRNA (guanine(527)-N(7))-methyltransferase RsmG [Paracoccaceae bacterium]